MNFRIKELLRDGIYRVYLTHSALSPKLNERIFSFKEEANFPETVHPENINICNSSCVMCPYPKMTRKKGRMSWNVYKKLIDESVKQNKKIQLWLYMFGEPLIDKEIEKKVEYAKEKGISKIYISTNAFLLDEKRAKSLLESGIDVVTFSFDGITKETYEKLRKGLNFERVMENTKNFIELRNKKNYDTKIRLQIINMKETKKELGSFVKFWKKLADEVVVIPYHDYAGQQKTENSKEIKQKFKIPCPYLWNKIVILWNGDVTFCCLDYDGKIIVGNIKDESLMDIWNGKNMKAIRKMHLENRQNELFLCNNCSGYEDIQKSFIIYNYIENTPILNKFYKLFRGDYENIIIG